MPRVHHRKARKNYKDAGIKKGEMYYTWSLRQHRAARGRVYRQKTPPMPWQLTNSAFEQTRLQIEHRLQTISGDEVSDLDSEVEEIKSEIENLRDETQGSLDNMPEGLQQGDTGQLLQERVDNCDAWISEIEGISLDEFEPDEDDDDETNEKNKKEHIEELAGQLRDISYPG